MRVLTIVLVLSILLSGCSVNIDGAKYKKLEQPFDLKTFFSGDVKAWGIVQDSSGNVVQRFTVDIAGKYENNTLVLDETFYYDIGNGPKTRVWTITEAKPGYYEGSATDIPGPAAGRDYGNAFYWGYEMDLPVGDQSSQVKFDDWIWAFDQDRIINRSYIKKFGITMAEVTIFMQKMT